LRSCSTLDREMVKIESDPLCKAHYFTHPQNGQTLAAYGDHALVEDRNAGSSSQRRSESRLPRNSGLSLGRTLIQTIFKVIT
jgi:hypothetical protein